MADETMKITTVYADGRKEVRDATPEEIAQHQDRILSIQTDFSRIRAERTAKLAATDWTQLPDAPLTEEEKQAWADYRQALRDLSESFTTVDQVVWPTEP
jgi:DNA replication initiation complex subunit (GINS family)